MEYHTNTNIKYGVLHKPWATNLPLVDAFYFVDSNPVTLVRLRMTTAGEHHTTASTVRQFTECLAAYFDVWEELSRDMSLGIIYLQHEIRRPMVERQRCHVDNSDNVGDNIKPRDCGVLGGRGAPVHSSNNIRRY
ncbi:retrotransposon hot spot (RHS) protein [Trypanosoma cruzi]|nr:retrotransposon hot spot (RHS) protein [Trypanosoma cruzi]